MFLKYITSWHSVSFSIDVPLLIFKRKRTQKNKKLKKYVHLYSLSGAIIEMGFFGGLDGRWKRSDLR